MSDKVIVDQVQKMPLGAVAQKWDEIDSAWIESKGIKYFVSAKPVPADANNFSVALQQEGADKPRPIKAYIATTSISVITKEKAKAEKVPEGISPYEAVSVSILAKTYDKSIATDPKFCAWVERSNGKMFLTCKPVKLKSGNYKIVLNDTDGKTPSTETVPEDTMITTSNLFEGKKASTAKQVQELLTAIKKGTNQVLGEDTPTPEYILALAEKLTTHEQIQLAHNLIGLAKSKMSNPD